MWKYNGVLSAISHHIVVKAPSAMGLLLSLLTFASIIL